MDTTTKTVNTSPLVTVLMLSYNRAKYISTAIDSVLAQTYSNFELVIIDDGSSDNTADILASYTDPRIKSIMHQDNAGLHKRRAESLTYIKGKYVAVLDSDDVWIDTKKIEEQVSYLETHEDCTVLGTFITLCDPAGNTIGQNSYHTTDRSIREAILGRNQFTHSSVLMRTRSLQEVTGYRDTGLAEDLDLILQLGQVGTFGNIPKYMTAYRIHTESFNPQKKAMSLAVLHIISLHKDHYPNYYRARCKAKFRLLYRTFQKLIFG